MTESENGLLWNYLQANVVNVLANVKEIGVTEEEVHRALGIMATNAADLQLDKESGLGKGTGLFPLYAVLNHSCL